MAAMMASSMLPLEATPGLYDHDLAAERARMRAKMPWLLGLALILAIVAVALGWYNAHHVRPLP
jgi:hypothetical protein